MTLLRMFICALPIVALSACSADTSNPPLTAAPFGAPAVSQMRSAEASIAAVPTAIYVADHLNNTVDVFSADGRLLRTIRSGLDAPNGLYLDGNQNLWVANRTNILMFENGHSTPSRTLEDPTGFPADVVVAKNGTVYVSNLQTSDVSVFANGSNVATSRLRIPGNQSVIGVANDAAGDVFVTYNDSTNVGRLDEFVGGVQSGLKRLPPRFSYAGDIKIDKAGNLLILDEIQHSINEYTKTGIPTGLSFNTFYQWNAFDISANGSYIGGAQAMVDHDLAVLATFPGGKTMQSFYNHYNGGLSGIALAPGHDR